MDTSPRAVFGGKNRMPGKGPHAKILPRRRERPSARSKSIILRVRVPKKRGFSQIPGSIAFFLNFFLTEKGRLRDNIPR